MSSDACKQGGGHGAVSTSAGLEEAVGFGPAEEEVVEAPWELRGEEHGGV